MEQLLRQQLEQSQQHNFDLQTPEKKQIYTYESDWTLYAINFSNKPERDFRLSLGSFIEDTQNKVEIIRLNDAKGEFERCTVFEHEYPPTKIMWIPDLVNTNISQFKSKLSNIIIIIGRKFSGLTRHFR
jgi:hypothetical protein